MSIHFVTGKPGAGKGLFTMRLILDELLYGNRCIVTNFAVKLPELNEYLQREYPDKTINLHVRIRLITEEQSKRFWLYRGVDRNGDWQTLREVDDKLQFEPALEEATHMGVNVGVFYVLDEIHNTFNVREWMKTGKGCLFYLTQHRKLSDTVICQAISINLVDKQFKAVAQDYTYCRNHGKERLGIFRRIPIFTWSSYGQPYTGVGQESLCHGTFSLDVKGLAQCYDTAVGVGVMGAQADKGERKTGLHPAWMLVLLALGALIVFYGPDLIGKYASGQYSKKTDTVVTVPAGENPAGAAIKVYEPSNNVASDGSAIAARTSDRVESTQSTRSTAVTNDEPWIVGVIVNGGAARVILSDGRVFNERDPKLQYLSADRNMVIYDGKTYRFKRGGLNNESGRSK